jgi:cytochrome P450
MPAMRPQLAAYDPLAPADLTEPHAAWARARREAPVFFEPGSGCWMVARHADVLRVLRDPSGFSSSRSMDPPPRPGAHPRRHAWAVPSLANADPPAHTIARKVVNRAFTRSRAATLEQAVRSAARALVDEHRTRGRAELIADIARPLAERSALAAIGLPLSDLPRLRQWLEAVDVIGSPDARGDALAHAVDADAGFASHCAGVLSRPAAGDHLIGVLSRGGLTPEVALSALLQVLMAAIATTAHAIVHAVRLTLEHGRFDLGEALRFDPAVRGMPRTVTRDVILGDARLEAGDDVLLLFGSANRDGSVFSDPDAYLPGRADGAAQLTFGRGTHFCPGAPLARIQISAALDALTELPGLARDEDHPLEPYPNLAIRAFKAFHVHWDPAG